MIWQDTEWVRSVYWVTCSSNTCRGLQLRMERPWACTCSEDSRQGLGQVGPFRAWQDTPQQLTIICLHTPLLGKHSREVGRERRPSSHLWVISPEGDALTFSHSSWGFKAEDCFPNLCPLTCPVSGVGEPLTESSGACSKWICDKSLLRTSV